MSNAGYPPPQQHGPPGWGAPPAPQQPKKMGAGKAIGLGCGGIVAVLVIIGVVGAIASSGDSSTSSSGSVSASGGSSTAKEKDATTEAAEEKPGAKDVKITACKVDDFTSWPSAKLTITNNSSKTSNYMVQVEFVDSSGTRLDEGMAAANNVAPGQSAKETAQGLSEVKGKITCKVTDVTRYAS